MPATLKAPPMPRTESRPLRVLVVEDSAPDADLLVRELKRCGYGPDWQRVDDAASLRRALGEQRWDVVLSDYSMPGFSALDALQIVQASGLDIPFIVVSGAIGEETAVEAIRAGARDYLLKDRMGRLGTAIERVLQEAEQQHARRRAEERVRLLFQAVEQSPAIVAITDVTGRIEYVNPRFTALTGYTLAEVRGNNPRVLKSGEVPEVVFDRLWRTISAGGQWRGDFANRKKNGEIFWESACISPVRNASGEITHFIKVGEDITERRRVEESLRTLESQLRQAQKMDALGELAGGIAHDFNSFLGAVIMNAQLVLNQVSADSTAAEYVDRILQASRQAAGLARQMLTFSRPDEQQRLPVQLGTAVREALRLLEAALPPNVEVQVEIPPEGRCVLADSAQIQQLVVNLWSNAVHALDDRGGRITVTLADVDVDRETAQRHHGLKAGPYVRLTVRDDGCGMTPETVQRIFEPLYTTKPAWQGTGLGLPVVQNIVRAHDGAIAVETRPNLGSEFHLYFPEHSGEAAAEAGSTPVVPRGASQRVLLVDDHSLVREAVSNMMEELEYRVTSYASPIEALNAFHTQPEGFDLAIIDMSMKEMSGAELSRQLAATRPNFPIILSSGYDLSVNSQHLRDLGISEVLMKPVTSERLAAALSRALSRNDTAA